MRFGVHIRIDRGLVKALDRARYLGCEAVQLFSGNPNAWQRTPLDPVKAEQFAQRAAELDIHPIILHTPYLVNLAAPDGLIYRLSREVLADAVAKAPFLGSAIVVTHIGSHKGKGLDFGINRISEAVKYALDAAEGACIALELGSGAGYSIGSTFEEIAMILGRLQDQTGRVGICIDTAHLWGSGYDISNAEGVRQMLTKLDELVGMERLKLIHLNDTLFACGSKRDRHFHIGKGKIGTEGFKALVNAPGTEDLPGIIETPYEGDDFDMQNLDTLRALRAEKDAGSESW